VDVTFTANGVTGRPPITFTWEVSSGYRFFGNPGVLSTQNLPAGSYTLRLAATNSAGTTRTLPLAFSIEPLRSLTPPACTDLGNRTAACSANTEGAVEYRWTWGDGNVSAWTAGCPGAHPSHTYAAAGTYTARLEARNCRDGTISPASFAVTVTSQAPLAIPVFAAVCSPFCLFHVGETVSFNLTTQGNPTTYAYDWDGNGTTDQVSSAPVATHRFTAPGSFRPRLTVSRGTQAVSASVPIPLFIQPASGPIFADGFESGSTGRWALVVGQLTEVPRP